MTDEHLAGDRIAEFLRGELSSSDAEQVAIHMDECSMCSARARGIDPLQPSFASCEEPEVPDRLVADVLRDLPSQQSRRPMRLLAACMAVAVGAIAVSVMGSIGALDLTGNASEALVGASIQSSSPASVFTWLGIGVLVALLAGGIAIRKAID